jgi:two-component system, NtrC family, sensor histidine kinase HydH
LRDDAKIAETAADAAPGASRQWRLAWMVGVIVILGTLQYLTAPSQMHWLYILQRLYYIPVVLAGLTMGWRGGLTVALLAGVAFAIGTPSIWRVSSVDVMDQILEVCVFCLVGTLAGVLSDRQRKQEADLRTTTTELREAQQELKKNFENVRLAERIYALAQLSAGLAHEIRTPLASLEGAAALVQSETQSEERRREFLDIIQKESRRLNRMLTSFLEFARPRQPDLQPVEIADLVDSVILLVRHSGGTTDFKVQKQMHPDVPQVHCDPEQLKQVLLNLVINARQAMAHGGTVLLEVRGNGANIHIDVHDQGGGIDGQNLDRIFDPFFTTKGDGTGLGLSVAYQIVSQHRGRLSVIRNSPEGVTMRVSLPLQPGRV